MNLRLIFTNLRLVIWPLFMAYVAFLLATTKRAASLNVMITAAFLGAMIGFCLGIMFANRAHRKAHLHDNATRWIDPQRVEDPSSDDGAHHAKGGIH